MNEEKFLQLISLYDELVGIQTALLTTKGNPALSNHLKSERDQFSQKIEVLREKLLPITF
jgi:hypothetical protein|tara:strand:- start:126 stop:305 length:180 start_codon:yes stop_codon:yes gene_type:complete